MLDEARTSVAQRAWDRAYERYATVAASRPLDADDLERFAKSAYWLGHADESISLREAAYAATSRVGTTNARPVRAHAPAGAPREHAGRRGAAWLKRAEHLLEGRPDSFADTAPADGYLAIAHADAARARGDFARALGLVDRASRIGEGSSDPNLRAWAMMRRALFLVDEGRLGEGDRLMEDVAASAAAGGLGGVHDRSRPHQRDEPVPRPRELPSGLEWSDAARRWLARQPTRGFAGICGIHRSQLSGCSATSRTPGGCGSRVRRSGGGEPGPRRPRAARVGEVRLRLGDLDGAAVAFDMRRSSARTHSPGSRCCGSRRTIRPRRSRRSTAASREPPSTASPGLACWQRKRRSPGPPPTRSEPGLHGTSSAEIAEQLPSPAVRAASAWAEGIAALAEDDPETASRHLEHAREGWSVVSAPYETAKADVALAEAALQRGDVNDATARLRSAGAAFERLGAKGDANGWPAGRNGSDAGVAHADRPDVPLHGHRQLHVPVGGDRRRGVG